MSLPALPRDAPSLEALRTAVDGLDEHVTLLAPDGRVVHVNLARRAAASQDPEQAAQLADRDPLTTAAAGDARARAVAAGIREVLAGERPAYEIEYTARSRWFAVRATPIAVDGVGALVVQTDVTARHHAQHAAGRPTDPAAPRSLASRRVLAERLEELLATGPVGIVVLRLRRSGPRSLAQLGPGGGDVVPRTVELLEQLVPDAAVTGRHGADRFVVLLPAVDEAGLRRAAVPLAAGWRARIGRPEQLEATVETVLAQPGELADDVLARAAGGLGTLRGAAPAPVAAARG